MELTTITHLHAIILGVVEGFTEFLPISSTAHLVLAAHALGLSQDNFTKTFEIAIQSGAIFAVLTLYWRKFLDIAILTRILAAFFPTALIGLLFYKTIKTHLIGNIPMLLTTLALGGAALIVFEYMFAKKGVDTGITDIKRLSYKKLFAIGIFQSVAMIPGVSRSAVTIVGGMLLGLKRESIVEFSFLLAVPTMLAATSLDVLRSYESFSPNQFTALTLGWAASFITALISLKLLLRYVKTHTFVSFGIYRIGLVAFILLYIAYKTIA